MISLPLSDVFAVRVGFTSHRPLRPDEHTAWVQVAAPDETEARLTACLIVGGWVWCEMVTRAEAVGVEV